MLKQLYNHSSIEGFVDELEQYKAYKAIADGDIDKNGKPISKEVTLVYADGTEAMGLGEYENGDIIYFYNDFANVSLNGASSIQPLKDELNNETVTKIQFTVKEALELDEDNKPISRDLSNSVLFVNIDAIRGYLVSIDGNYGIYKYETSDNVATKIRYLALDDQRDEADTNQFIILNYYTTN